MIISTSCKADYLFVRRAYEEKNLFSHFYCSVCSRILVNVKLLFFSPAVSLKNIPFEGVITEADSGKIVVKGDGTNGCGLTEHYQIYNSDQIKIVNTNDELIQFTDLKKGTRISMRLWIKEKTLYNDMDRLDIVTLIQCCE